MTGSYYVTMLRGARVAFLAGPFDTHEAALEMVDAARDAAYEVDPFSWFDDFGTSSLKDNWAGPAPAGVLNRRLGISGARSLP